jgi:tetratricopeptide (TPR) repeat protein
MPSPRSKKSAKTETEYEKALELLHNKDYRKASTAFSRIEKSSSNDRIAARATTYRKNCEAMLMTAKAKSSGATAYDLAVFEHNNGNYKDAIKLFDKALKSAPKGAHIYLAKAASEAQLGNVDAAMENLKKSVELDERSRFSARLDTDFSGLAEDQSFVALVRPAQV